ncbi:sodium:solute symporter family protein [Luteolibacter soli]|uniref:Sodium:solute symporter family protein n=1 Tax=Luteolibacter soli TaxID=3135280 RepID=A0ABU9AZX9_9BACT
MALSIFLNPALLGVIQLSTLDWVIIVGSILVCFVPALFYGKKSGESTSEFFASGQSVPWWLAGLSMVATTFSSDTPNWVTEQVRKFGVAGNWQWWAFVLTGVATVFFFARLWRRSGVMTDLEFYELRYSGKAASVVRGFRAVYLGLFFNCFIMGMVTLAACKIANILFGLDNWQTILICGVLNVVFAAHSGLWGVLIIDMVQFFIKMTAVFAAAYFALKEVARRTGVGETAFAGLHKLVEVLGTQQVVTPKGAQPVMSVADGTGQPILDVLPNFGMWDLALMIFLVPIAIGWWANWYPGAEPGGGSYIAQRMLASKSEKDSLGGTLFFNIAHYVLRPWPWIITALCSIIVYPDLASIKEAFPDANPNLIGHDSAFPAMLKFLPVGFMGLMVGGLIAANSSTILTHLNWGASYLVHDFYRRFIKTDGTEKHYVSVGRVCTLLLYVVAASLSYALTSAQEAFEALINIGAGTGLLYIVRWFWWRVNAWCEIVAMAAAVVTSVTLFALKKTGHEIPFAPGVICSVAFTTVCWLSMAFLAPQTDRKTLISFFRKVQPAGPGWNSVRREAGVPESTVKASGDHMGLATLGWVSGCALIWSSLFAIGKFLYGEMTMAWILTGVLVVSGLVLLQVIRKLWS